MVALRFRRVEAQRQPWTSAAAPPVYVPPVARNVRRGIDQLRATDENFSFVLFEDFLYALYAEIHTARGSGQLARYSAFLAPQAAASMTSPPGLVLSLVKDIVIGSMTFVDARGTRGTAPEATVRVRFQSNYTEVGSSQRETSYYASEEWTLSRKRGAKSRTPDKASLFVCPACGAPLDAVTAGKCAHCGNLVSSGEFDWVVRSADAPRADPARPDAHGRHGRGGQRPADARRSRRAGRFCASCSTRTRASPGKRSRRASFAHLRRVPGRMVGEGPCPYAPLPERPALRGAALLGRGVHEAAPSQRDRERPHPRDRARAGRARPLLRRLTVRVWATGLDYTRRGRPGKVVSGSRSRERRYSEYWTIVRSANEEGGRRAPTACARTAARPSPSTWRGCAPTAR